MSEKVTIDTMDCAVTSATTLVSVIIPCFNQARFVRDAWNSVRAQTVSSWEAIFVNDGSTDRTVKVLEEIAGSDSRVVVITQRNRGLAAARNRGIGAARGRFVQFLDADDAIASEKFEVQLAKLERCSDLALCYCDYCVGREEDLEPLALKLLRNTLSADRPDLDFAQHWESELSIPIHTYLFDRRFFSDCNLRFDETLENHEDFDLGLTALRLRPRIEYVPRVLAVYRQHAQSMTRNHRRMRKGFLRAIEKQCVLAVNDAAMERILREKIAPTRLAYDLLIQKDQSTRRAVRRARLEERLGELLPASVKRLIRRVQGRI